MLARGLLDLQFIDADAGRFEGHPKLAEAVAKQSCRFVIGGLERGGDDAVADINLHIERAKLRRIEADVHGAAVGKELAVDGGENFWMIVLNEGLLRRERRRRRGLIEIFLGNVGLRENKIEFWCVDLLVLSRCSVLFGRSGSLIGQFLRDFW